MKKHQLVAAIGTLALAVNLIVPGLAFGADQTGNLTVQCAGRPAASSLERVPATVTFAPVTSPLVGTLSTVDFTAGDFSGIGSFPGGNTVSAGIGGTSVTDDHLIRVKDITSNGVDGCGGSEDDRWAVTATISSTDFNGDKALVHTVHNTSSILASAIKMVTTDTVDTTNISNGGPAIAEDSGVFYDNYTSTGNAHAVVAGSVAGSADFSSTTGIPAGTYDSGSNTLDQAAVPVLKHCVATSAGTTSENADIYLGVAIAIDSGIQAFQEQGTYTGTIQYTMTSGVGAGC